MIDYICSIISKFVIYLLSDKKILFMYILEIQMICLSIIFIYLNKLDIYLSKYNSYKVLKRKIKRKYRYTIKRIFKRKKRFKIKTKYKKRTNINSNKRKVSI